MSKEKVVGTDEADDEVNHPSHYRSDDGKMEVIEVTEAWYKLPAHLVHVIEYVLRAKKKGHYLKDLRKARWYLDREITNKEAKEVADTKV